MKRGIWLGLLLVILPGLADWARHPSTMRALAAVTLSAPAHAEDEGDRGDDNGRADDSRGEDRDIDDADWDQDRDSAGDDDRGERDDDGLDFEPDVVLAVDLSDAGRERARRLGFHVVDEETLGDLGLRLTELATPGGLPTELALKRLRQADPDGVYDVNARYFTSGEDSCSGIRCAGQRLIGWPIAGCRVPVRVGMLDTAVATSAVALIDRPVLQQHFGRDVPRDQDADHGTEIASILVGRDDAGVAGLLPQATLIAADVFDRRIGDALATDAFLMARGFNWVLAQRAAVINVAIAGPDNQILREAVKRVIATGVPVVAAAGNAGPDAPPQYPAAYPQVIAVTAVDHLGHLYPQANRGGYIALAAPGVNVWAMGANGHGRFVEGTSFATPFVSAEVALLRAADPALAPDALRVALLKQARPPPGPAAAGDFGAGLLQSHACAAVAAADAAVAH